MGQSSPAAVEETAKGKDPTGNKVEGLELPSDQQVDESEQYVDIDPKIDPEWKVEKVDWIVVFASRNPTKVREKGNTLTVGLPKPGESVFVYADAFLYQEKEIEVEGSVEVAEGQWEKKKVKIQQKVYKKTKHAVTVITVKGGSSNNPTSPIRPSASTQVSSAPTPLPNNIGPLHIILILNQNNPSPAEKAISNSELIRKTLQAGKHEFYPMDPTSRTANRPDLKALIDKAGTPCLIIMDAQGRSLTQVQSVDSQGRSVVQSQAIKFPLSNDHSKNEFLLLDMVGRIVSSKSR